MALNLEEAFRVFQAKKWHSQMAWSAVADNGISVITLWTDLHSFNKDTKVESWSCFNQGNWWYDTTGNKQRIMHLHNALDNCQSFFRAIMVTPVSTDVESREIDFTKGCKPAEHKWWKIEEFNSQTGEFSAICRWEWNKSESFPV